MAGFIDLIANAFNPVTPASVPLPRLRPSAVGPVASQQADAGQPRIRVTGAARTNVGNEPLSVEPVTPDDSSSGDPYADVPRLQPRTGIRRFGYNAAAGLSAVPADADPITGFANAYLGAQNAEQSQTAAERTAAIDEVNRELERKKYEDAQARQARLDAADLDVKSSTATLNRAKAAHGGYEGRGLDRAKYYDLLIRKEVELNQHYGLNNPNLSSHDPRRAELQELVRRDMDAFKLQLQADMNAEHGQTQPANGAGGGPITVDDALDATDDTAPVETQPGGEGAPPKATRSVEKAPKGAIPDNITGDGSLKAPFRVKNPKDPTLKSKIRVGDHFIYLNPKTGREEIRIRDR